MIYVIAKMEINEGCRDAVIKLLAGTVPQVLSEEGCIMYTPCLEADAGGGGNVITIVEAWKSLELQQAHLASPHMVEYREAIKDLRKGCQVDILTPVL